MRLVAPCPGPQIGGDGVVLATRVSVGLEPPVSNLTLLPGGRLFTAVAAGKFVTDRDAWRDPWRTEQVMARYGDSSGEQWGEPERLFDLPSGLGCWTCPPSLLDREGVSHLFGLRLLPLLLGAEPVVPDIWRSDLWHASSADGGATWLPPERLDYGHGYTSALNSAVQLRSGRIMVPLGFYDRTRPAGKLLSKVVYSDDSGRSWRHDSTELHVASGGEHAESGADEPVVVELGDGRGWMVIRTTAGGRSGRSRSLLASRLPTPRLRFTACVTDA